MTATPEARRSPDEDNMRLWYWILGAFLIVLAIIGLITYAGKKEDEEAQQKAAQLTQAFQKAGLRVPVDPEVFVDSGILVGGALILQTYCPEKLEEFKEKTDGLKTDDVIKR